MVGTRHKHILLDETKEIPGVKDFDEIARAMGKAKKSHTKPDKKKTKQDNRKNNSLARKQRRINRKK